MRRFFGPGLLVLILTSRCLAQDATTQPILIDVADKAAVDAANGKFVVVEGIISNAVWSRSGAVMNIDFQGAQRSRFFAVVFQRHRAKLDEAFAGDLAKTLTGAKVRLRGLLGKYDGPQESFKGRPQLIVDVGAQITILELAPAAAR